MSEPLWKAPAEVYVLLTDAVCYGEKVRPVTAGGWCLLVYCSVHSVGSLPRKLTQRNT